MKHNWKSCLYLYAALSSFAGTIWTQTPTPIKVLWMGGNNSSHNVSAQRDIFVPILEDSGFTVTYTTNIDEAFHIDTLNNYDVFFVWTGLKGSQAGLADLSQQQEDDLVNWVEAGNGMVAVHAASSAWIQNSGYMNLIGGNWTVHGPGNGAQVQPVTSNHPSVEGVEPYDYLDEGRLHEMLRDDLDTVLFATQETMTDIPWAWVHDQGDGRVYYTAGGHNTGSISTSEFQFQLIQALRWAHDGGVIPVVEKKFFDRQAPIDLKMQIKKQGLRLTKLNSLAAGHLELFKMSGQLVADGDLNNNGFIPLPLSKKLEPGVYFYLHSEDKAERKGRIQLMK